MADKWPLANGNWSNAANWNGGTKPGPSDDVFADGKTVTIDEDITVASIRTTQRSGGTAGGGFVVNTSGKNVLANVIGGNGAATLTHSSSGTLTITGDVVGSSTLGDRFGIRQNAGTGTVIVNGDVSGGSASNGAGISVSAGSLVVNGNVSGGIGAVCSGILASGTSTFSVTGDVIGGTGGAFSVLTANGIYVSQSSSGTITGQVTGGTGSGATGLRSVSSGIVTINGNCFAGTGGSAVSNESTGFCEVNGDVYASTSRSGVVGFIGLNGNAFSDANGINGASGRVLIHPTNVMRHEFKSYQNALPSNSRSAYTGGVNIGQPIPADVRFGTQFGASNEYTGTLRVPDPQYVSIGVLTDDTVGTLAVDLQPILDAIANITVDNAAIAGAVRTELATELGRIDVATSSRLAAASYVAAPSAAANAGAVRTELATELGRIDAAITTRLAAADYVEPSGTADLSPETIQDIAEAVAGNVTPGVGSSVAPVDLTTLRAFQGETVTQSVTAFAADKTTPLDLSGKTLVLLFETEREAFVASIPNNQLTIGGANNNVLTFTYPAAVTADRSPKIWSLRDAANPRKVYLHGLVEIRRAATKTAAA